MATEFFGIVYFPTKSAFFEGAIPESMEAKYGIKGPYFLIKILCKIYKEGYYIPWDEEQCEIFAYKLGREYSKEEVTSMVSLLLEKGFFDKESYQKQQILTSLDIQRVWLEATSRRKRDLTKLPYLLEEIKCRQNTSSKSECADIPPAQMELNLENADISRQTKLKETKLNSEEEEINDASIEIPGYAYNLATHNIAGLMESLDNHKVTDQKEKQTILRLSDYGRKGTQVWKLLSNTTWSKIGAPGKYIIAALASGRK